MNDFEIKVYDKNLNYLGMIDDFSSLRWRRKYFEAGEFEIHLLLDDNIEKFLSTDNILVRTDSVEAGIIESIITSDNGEETNVQIIGRFLSSILDRRIIKTRINFSGTYLNGERALLKSMTPFSDLIIEETNLLSDNVIFQCTYQNVYNYLNRLAKASTIAHRIIPDIKNKKFIYQNYVGLDRTENQIENTRFEFSEDRGNLAASTYTISSKSEKNYALVGGEGEGTSRVLMEVKKGEFTDFELREVFVNASQERKDDKLTDNDYKTILSNRGYEALADITENIDINTYADNYKTDWDLGDIVNAKKESWGIKIKQRIVEVEETIENNNRSISIVLGNPLPETLATEEN